MVKTDDSEINAKIDSLIYLEKAFPYFPDSRTVYTMLHAFKLKTIGNGMVLKVYTFYLDADMNILDVDKDSPEEQIQKNKDIISRAEKKKQLISDIAKLKIAHIKKPN